jgi:2-keto-4-pentenoate hydratase
VARYESHDGNVLRLLVRHPCTHIDLMYATDIVLPALDFERQRTFKSKRAFPFERAHNVAAGGATSQMNVCG